MARLRIRGALLQLGAALVVKQSKRHQEIIDLVKNQATSALTIWLSVLMSARKLFAVISMSWLPIIKFAAIMERHNSIKLGQHFIQHP